MGRVYPTPIGRTPGTGEARALLLRPLYFCSRASPRGSFEGYASPSQVNGCALVYWNGGNGT